MLIFSAVISCAAAEDVYSLPVDFTPGAKPLPSNYLSETEYQDPSLHVTIETGRKDECDYWVARIKISHPSQLRTAAAAGFENDYTTKGTFIAKRQNAVLAIDGDYFCYSDFGFVLRQGELFMDELQGERDVLAIDEDGNFHTFGLERTPEAYIFYIDGKESWRVTPDQCAPCPESGYMKLTVESAWS